MPSFNPGMESCASVLLAARKPCPSSFCGPALSTAFHKWLPQLWASSLDGGLLPCRRCVIPATGGNASASPQCWRMQAALLHPQRCFVGLCFLHSTDGSNKAAQSFQWPQNLGRNSAEVTYQETKQFPFPASEMQLSPRLIIFEFFPKIIPFWWPDLMLEVIMCRNIHE